MKKRTIYFESLAPYYNSGAAPLRGFIEEAKKFIDSPLPEYYNLETDFGEEHNAVRKIDLEVYQKKLEEHIQAFSSSQTGRFPKKLDRESLDKLRSLGYVSSTYMKHKKNYTQQDDLKSLLPFQQRLDEAIVYFDKGKIEESVRILTKLTEDKKNMVNLYLYLHYIYKIQGRFEKSLELMSQGYDYNPDNFDIVSAYGILLVEAGKWDEGIAVLQRALTMIDFDPMVWNYLGYAYWRKGEEKKALEHYAKALALDNSFAMTYANLGTLYLSRFPRTKNESDYFQAMEYFKKAIGHDPNLATAYRWLGVGYRIGGRPDLAITIWEKTLEIDPTDDITILELGKAHLDRGEKAKALEYFQKYLRLRKDSLTPEEQREIEKFIQRCKQKQHSFLS